MNEKDSPKTSQTDWVRVDALRDEDIDLSESPELDEAFFQNAVIRLPAKKVPVCLRLDQEVLDWFRAGGRRYQSRINAVLKAFIAQQQESREER
jgi:uncharacterized protein (DUF4415 family)